MYSSANKTCPTSPHSHATQSSDVRDWSEY